MMVLLLKRQRLGQIIAGADANRICRCQQMTVHFGERPARPADPISLNRASGHRLASDLTGGEALEWCDPFKFAILLLSGTNLGRGGGCLDWRSSLGIFASQSKVNRDSSEACDNRDSQEPLHPKPGNLRLTGRSFAFPRCMVLLYYRGVSELESSSRHPQGSGRGDKDELTARSSTSEGLGCAHLRNHHSPIITAPQYRPNRRRRSLYSTGLCSTVLHNAQPYLSTSLHFTTPFVAQHCSRRRYDWQIYDKSAHTKYKRY